MVNNWHHKSSGRGIWVDLVRGSFGTGDCLIFEGRRITTSML